ncbi:synaptic vesicle 2-related protein [Caerostris extrusa]|uniref:Synaptic vesicle 2-related protein n=1 Tax=Caerostris extrusa TaxID=172846 RepID=A0AAV4QU54_CAEEX|nr:synaptic vesicle 2-related protein [Caerostris extrusa]
MDMITLLKKELRLLPLNVYFFNKIELICFTLSSESILSVYLAILKEIIPFLKQNLLESPAIHHCDKQLLQTNHLPLRLAVTLTAYGTVFISPIIIQQGFLGKIEHNNQTYENASNSSLHPMPCVKFTQDNFMQLLAISAAEFPGLLLFTFLADKFGRKNLLSVSFLVDGCLLLLLLLRTHKVIILLVLFIARGMIISLFQLIYIITWRHIQQHFEPSA